MESTVIDLYESLKVDKKATLKEIKRAYRDLSKIHHPDKGGDEKEFHKIILAYEILGDPEKRVKYDNGEDVFNMKDPLTFVYSRARSIFKHIISKDNYRFIDVFQFISDQCDEAKQTLIGEIDKLKEEIDKNKDVSSRISGKNSTFFKDLLNQENEQIEQKIIKHKEEIEIADKLITFIKELKYKTDEEEKDVMEYSLHGLQRMMIRGDPPKFRPTFR